MSIDPEKTRHSLLVRITDASDEVAWSEFAGIYRPVIYRLARNKGLQDADADDLVQHVMSAVSRSIDRWEPDQDRASFRTWLHRIAHNAMIDFLRRRRMDRAEGGTSTLRRLSDFPDTSQFNADQWEDEHRREIFHWAARRVRIEFSRSTWAAFWETAVAGKSPMEAAQQLNMTVGSVYTARSRVMRRLKTEVQRYE